jgi:hypothetical protein
MKIKKIPLTEIKANEAFATHQRIVEREKKMRELKIENIADYDSLYKTQGYRVVLGDEEGEWTHYLAQLEIYRSRGEIHALVKMKEKLSDEWDFKLDEIIDIPLGRLGTIAMIAADKTQAADLITLARGATTKDWSEEINKLKGKPIPEDGHKHDNVTYRICKICGNKKVV